MGRPRKPRQRGRHQSKDMKHAIESLTRLFTDRILANDFSDAWSLNELTALVTGDPYVSDKKKWITYRALCVVRRDIHNTFGHLIYKVTGKGFTILEEQKDFVSVYKRGVETVTGFIRTLLIPVATRGKLLELKDEDVHLGITRAQELLKTLTTIKEIRITNQLT